tara:strand:+ start:463 stop:1017 length:555 start_codon:yes stop_codon:yes gene_type:complete
LARFKKRKWGAEKPKPKDIENKETPPTESDTPPTESDTPTTESESEPEEIVEVDIGKKIEEQPPKKESKTKETEESAEDKSATKKLTDRLFWMRVVFAVLGGIIATFVLEDIADPEQKRWTSIGFMIMIFISTVIIAKTWGIRIPRKKYVTTGIGSFIFLYLFSWIVSYTIANLETGPGVIPFP